MRVTEEEMEASADRQDEWSIYFRWFAKKKNKSGKKKKNSPLCNTALILLTI